jgi:hypothetical protein
MSLQTLADQMKSRGRNGDSELVHMTKGEVAGLQQLAMAAGGTLTINPDTGLPEASFLKQLLPTIIGVGLAPFTGGLSAAALGAGAGALLNKENPLMGAITGGLGAFGGHGLGAGLSAAGTAGAASAAAPSAGAIGQGASLGATQGLTQGAAQGLTATAPTAATGAQYGLTGAPSTYSLSSGATPMATAAVPTTAAPVTYDSMYKGIGALTEQPGRDAFMQSVGGGKGLMRSGAMSGAPLIMGAMTPRGGPSGMPVEEEDNEDLFGRYEYRANPIAGGRPSSSAFTGERRYFEPEYRRMYAAKGGEVKKFADGGEASASSSESDPARGMTGASRDALLYLYGALPSSGMVGSEEAAQYTSPNIVFRPAATQAAQAPTSGGDFYYAIPPGQFHSNMDANPQPSPFSNAFTFDQPSPYSGVGFFAEGGLASLATGGMKAGGFVVPADVVSMVGEGNTDAGYDRIKRMIPGATPIKGKDGGQADTVKTSIEGKQPARIAHGEMYVPPAAVKRAGGAKKLYAMMKNVRKQAKGDSKQIKPVNLKKAMA